MLSPNMADDQGNQPTDNSQRSTKKGLNLWKFVSIVLIVVLLGIGLYELGKSQTPPKNTFVMSPKPTVPVTQVTASATITPPTTGTVTPTGTASKKVSAGIKNQLFSPYVVTVPSSWADNHVANTASDTLTLTKGQYVLTISQAAGGAGSCDYPSDTVEPMAQVFTNFVGITGTFSQFRRGTTDNKTYTVCEQKSGGFAFPTSVGYITYAVPVQADQATLAEMDGMVASLTK
jgi:hypothetical protein